MSGSSFNRRFLVADIATSSDWSKGDFLYPWYFINVGDQTSSMSYKHGAHSSNAKWPHPWKQEVVCVRAYVYVCVCACVHVCAF